MVSKLQDPSICKNGPFAKKARGYVRSTGIWVRLLHNRDALILGVAQREVHVLCNSHQQAVKIGLVS